MNFKFKICLIRTYIRYSKNNYFAEVYLFTKMFPVFFLPTELLKVQQTCYFVATNVY